MARVALLKAIEWQKVNRNVKVLQYSLVFQIHQHMFGMSRVIVMVKATIDVNMLQIICIGTPIVMITATARMKVEIYVH